MSRFNEWLGEDFRDLLPQLRGEDRRVFIAVTRPFGHSYGEGRLRVVRVQSTSEQVQLLLAYERYLSPPRGQKARSDKPA